jgi:hypothetical protein
MWLRDTPWLSVFVLALSPGWCRRRALIIRRNPGHDLCAARAAKNLARLVRARLQHAEDDTAVPVEELGRAVGWDDANMFGHGALLS